MQLDASTDGAQQVAVVGIKAGYAVQAVCQVLCSAGYAVSVARECVQDDNQDRLAAVVQHLLPVYADVVSLADLIDNMIGMDLFAELQAAASGSATALMAQPEPGSDISISRADTQFSYAVDCGRGGHASTFVRMLLERPRWRTYPTQLWYQDAQWKHFKCPLGKVVVDFSDEPQFSRTVMYLKGRDWLDDKSKVTQLAGDHMPTTYIVENGQWEGARPPDMAAAGPWFVKETDKNWGRCVKCYRTPHDIMENLEPGRFVVQQHVVEPLLTTDGRKCHLKFYILLICAKDGRLPACPFAFYSAAN
eukprot:SAG31_NODE_2912_length_4920_cov_3.413192_2_plen_305_part_00